MEATEVQGRTTISVGKDASDMLRLLAIDRRQSVASLFDDLFQSQLEAAYQEFINREHAGLAKST